jgi:hypothetical protein
MGWTSFDNHNKKQVIDRIKEENTNVSQWSVVGNNMWGLLELPADFITKNTEYKLGDKAILLYKLASFDNNEYGYKEMCESVHPFAYNCPLKYLKQAVVVCQEWRDGVVKFHNDKSKLRDMIALLMYGDIIKLNSLSVPEVRIVSVKPLLGVSTANGKMYKISSRNLITQ